ncbi:MAG: DUF3237 domain-containing protein [Chloroflexi bacterium]|nr:DUF3237 domain-containing protein [Chloroflexota bacterium]
MPLESEFLFSVSVELDPDSQLVGPTPQGDRTIVYVTGGTFEGPKLRGEVLPGGGDWIRRRADGVMQLDVRATLRTDDGALIYVQYSGINDASPEVREKRARGEEVAASELYFRTTPYFETGAEKYAWLNKIVAVGVGRFEPNGVGYDIYAIK